MDKRIENINDEDLQLCVIAGVQARGLLVQSDVIYTAHHEQGESAKEAHGRVAFLNGMPKRFCSNVTYRGRLVVPGGARLVEISVYLSPKPSLMGAETTHGWSVKGVRDLLWEIQSLGAPTDIESIQET